MSFPKISATSSSSTNWASLICARAALAMKVASGLRWAAAASCNSSYASSSNRKVTVLAMFPLPLVNSVPGYNGTSIKSATIIVSLWVRPRTETRRQLAAELAEKVDFLPKLLDRSTSPEDLHAEGIRVHRQASDRRGFSVIEVSASWCIVFWFEGW